MASGDPELMVEQPELVESFRRLVPLAVAGDRSAAAGLLGALIDRVHERQAAASRALHSVSSREFWSRLVEFLATSRWQGGRLSIPALQSDVWQHKLRHHLHVLFTLHHDPESDAAREAALAGALRHRSAVVRACAADLLGERRARGAADELIRALDDPAPAVRIHAARALGRLEDPAAVDPLLRSLDHRNDALAGAAVDALVQLGPRAVPALIDACRAPDEWVRWHAARALGRLRDPRAIAPLVELLDDPDAAVRWAAVQALQRYGAAAVEPAVRSLTTRAVTPTLADAAGHFLRQVKEPRLAAVLRPLGEHLRDSYAAVSAPFIAERVLGELREQPVGAGEPTDD
jgi:HEAT repeat protein